MINLHAKIKNGLTPNWSLWGMSNEQEPNYLFNYLLHEHPLFYCGLHCQIGESTERDRVKWN